MTSLRQNFPTSLERWRDTPTTHTVNSDLYQGSYTMLVMHGTLYRLLYHFSGLTTSCLAISGNRFIAKPQILCCCYGTTAAWSGVLCSCMQLYTYYTAACSVVLYSCVQWCTMQFAMQLHAVVYVLCSLSMLLLRTKNTESTLIQHCHYYIVAVVGYYYNTSGAHALRLYCTACSCIVHHCTHQLVAILN